MRCNVEGVKDEEQVKSSQRQCTKVTIFAIEQFLSKFEREVARFVTIKFRKKANSNYELI